MGATPENTIVGLDVGTTKIAAVAAEQRSDGGLTYVDGTYVDAAGVRNGIIVDIQEASASIEGALYDCGQFARFCSPGFDGVIACPCGNPPVGYDRGCNNSSNTGGAYLLPSGVASIAADTMHLSSASEKLNATSIFLQGSALTNVVFGQGVRCTGGTLKRLYVKTASGGSASAPSGTDPTMSARSAALGDVLAAGSTRYYNVYYRDPTVLGGCPSASTFNSTDAVAATWAP